MTAKRRERAAIYYRVSTTGQKDAHTIESQRQSLPAWAKAQGWDVVDTYTDEGLSGSSIKGRKDFQRLLEDMEQRKFDILLVIEHSRVTRTEDPAERGLILKALKDNKVKLASPAEGVLDLGMFSGELMTTLKLMFAAEERAEMARRTKRGRRAKLERGEYCLGQVHYGLRKVTDNSVRPPVHRVEIDKDEAGILRMVFHWVVEKGLTLHECARHLNELNIKPRRAKKWAHANLSAVLSNEGSLTGTVLVFKGEGNRRLELKVPAIFTPAEYALLKERISSRKPARKAKAGEEKFLLRGKLYCALCDSNLTCRSVKGVLYYTCPHKRGVTPGLPKEQLCPLPNVNALALDAMVEKEVLQRLFMFPEKTLKGWTSAQGKGVERELRSVEARLKHLDKRLQQQEAARARLLDKAIAGIFSAQEIKHKKQELDKAIAGLQEERTRLAREQKRLVTIRQSKRGVKAAAVDLRKVAKRVLKKIEKLSIKDKRDFLDIIIPGRIRVFPLHPSDYHSVALPGRRRAKVTWAWKYDGLLDVSRVVEAVTVFSKSGKIPKDYTYYLENNNHINALTKQLLCSFLGFFLQGFIAHSFLPPFFAS